MEARVLLLGGLREIDPGAPVLPAAALGVLRGESVFEATRIVSGRPCHLAEHLRRLARSADRAGIDLPAGFHDLAYAATRGVDSGSLRLVCTKGSPEGKPVGFALVTDIPAEALRARRLGVRAVSLPLGLSSVQRGQAPWLMGGVKHTSYAVNMASLRQAHAMGAQDAIWTSTDGFVFEAPTATVVALIGGELVSPPAAAGILPGITVRACQRLAPIAERPITLADLLAAPEVMLMSSVRGIAPVIWLDGRDLPIGPNTVTLSRRYESSLRPGGR